MISNIPFLLSKCSLPKYENRKSDNSVSANNQQSLANDCFISNNKNKKTNAISFSGLTSLEGFSKVRDAILTKPEGGYKIASIWSDFKPLDKFRTYCLVLDDSKIIGHVTVQHYDTGYRLSNNPKNSSHLYINSLDTKKDYKDNIYGNGGFELVKEIVKLSFDNGDEGRVQLIASKEEGMRPPIVFYFLLGFRAFKKLINTEISEKLSILGKNNSDIFDLPDELHMYLPKNQRSEWKEKI